MKKLIVATALSFSVLSLSNFAIAQSPPDKDEPKRVWASYSTVDDVQVPDDILLAIQMEFQGFAVTKAKKISRGGQDLYELRVDKSDIPADYDGFYLYFDLDWNVVEKEDINAPAPVFQPKPEPENRRPSEPEEREEDDDEDEQEETEPVEDDNSGPGDGDTEPEPEPDPGESVEPTDSNP